MTAGLVAPPDGRVDGVAFSVVGSGAPVTVFAHGIAGSAAETRPLAGRTAGTRVLLDLRGHGASDALPGGWDYDDYAADLLAVADHVGATRAVGLSLGAGALLRLLTRQADRFAAVAFVLPAALDEVRDAVSAPRLAALGAAMEARDGAEVERLLLAEVPGDIRARAGVRLLVGRRAAQLTARPPCHPRTGIPPLVPPWSLAAVTAPALVIGQAGDELHPLHVAERLAGELPTGRLLALPAGGVFWTAHRQVQDALATHLQEAP